MNHLLNFDAILKPLELRGAFLLSRISRRIDRNPEGNGPVQ